MIIIILKIIKILLGEDNNMPDSTGSATELQFSNCTSENECDPEDNPLSTCHVGELRGMYKIF